MFSRIKRYSEEIKKVRYLAYHDALTGLYNRHYLNNLTVNHYHYIYFIDINNLKDYNQNGHMKGDLHIIKCVNEISKNYLDDSSCFIRYAGDEFVVLSVFPLALTSNNLYSVGEYRITGDFEYCLNQADKMMMSNKSKIKLQK